MKKFFPYIIILLCPVYLKAQSVCIGQFKDKMKVQNEGKVAAYSFDLQDVRLLDSPFKDNMERESQWILSIDVNRLLHSFHNSAGVFSSREGGYFTTKKLGGWEALDCDLRGHTTGHILSGLALLYASTGDERYKTKADSLVKGLVEVQETLLRHNGKGYISAFPENLIDRNIAGQSVWAPFYTLHKIYAGLLDQYLYCNNQQALDIVAKAASWAFQKLIPLSEEQRKIMLRNEFGGINETFYNLYAITGNPEHKKLVEFFYHSEVIEPLYVDMQSETLSGKHANTFIPKIIAEARNYEISNSEHSKVIAQNFWKEVINHQTFCTGGNSSKEKFIPSDKISENLTGYTQETCNTYNMLKLTRHLFCQTADPKYADYYERALYNHILGQQDPESGMVAYFLPLLPGAHKVYSTPENSFWCCVGTGFENHAKYGEAIYYHTENELYVNLFIPSELTWKEKELNIKQETDFPEDEHVKLTISTKNPVKFILNMRYPSWTKNVEVKINGKKIKITQEPSSYIPIKRIWKNNDKVEVRYPMDLYLSEANDNKDVAAIMYGPLVLAGAMGTAGMVEPAPFSNPLLYNDYYTYDYHVPENVITSLHLNKNNLSETIEKTKDNNLEFVTREHIRLKPIHTIHRERYVVYWNLNK